MATNLEPLLRSVHNNARWCDRVCAAHEGPGVFSPLAWHHRRRCPPFYPNLVTLDPAAGRDSLAPLLAELAGLDGHAVKDSFGRLDLAGDGYRLLFEASWVWREAAAPGPGAVSVAPFRWDEAGTAEGLEAWEAAWWRQAGGADGHPVLYPASLLQASGIRFLAGRREGAIVAGCAVTLDQGVLGLACIFPGPADHPEVVASLAAHLRASHGDLPLAGYESGADLDCMRACGFRELGPLRVWLRDAGGA